jgi:hypothetical protein
MTISMTRATPHGTAGQMTIICSLLKTDAQSGASRGAAILAATGAVYIRGDTGPAAAGLRMIPVTVTACTCGLK